MGKEPGEKNKQRVNSENVGSSPIPEEAMELVQTFKDKWQGYSYNFLEGCNVMADKKFKRQDQFHEAKTKQEKEIQDADKSSSTSSCGLGQGDLTPLCITEISVGGLLPFEDPVPISSAKTQISVIAASQDVYQKEFPATSSSSVLEPPISSKPYPDLASLRSYLQIARGATVKNHNEVSRWENSAASDLSGLGPPTTSKPCFDLDSQSSDLLGGRDAIVEDHNEGTVGESCKSLPNSSPVSGVGATEALVDTNGQNICPRPSASSLSESWTHPNADANSQEYNPLATENTHTHGTTCLGTINDEDGIYMAADGCSWDSEDILKKETDRKISVLGNRILVAGAGFSTKYRMILHHLSLLISDDVTLTVSRCARFAHFILKWGEGLLNAGLQLSEIANIESELELEDLGLEANEVAAREECNMLFAAYEENQYHLFVATRLEVEEIYDVTSGDGAFAGSFRAHRTRVNNFVSIGSGARTAALEFLEKIPKSQIDMNGLMQAQHVVLMLELMQAAAEADYYTGGFITVYHIWHNGIHLLQKVHVRKIPFTLSRLLMKVYRELYEDALARNDVQQMETYLRLQRDHEEEYQRLLPEVLIENNREAEEKARRRAARIRTLRRALRRARLQKRLKPFNLLNRIWFKRV